MYYIVDCTVVSSGIDGIICVVFWTFNSNYYYRSVLHTYIPRTAGMYIQETPNPTKTDQRQQISLDAPILTSFLDWDVSWGSMWKLEIFDLKGVESALHHRIQ